MRVALATALALVAGASLALASPPSAAAARPVVLVVHGGGFVSGEAETMKRITTVFRAEGFRSAAVRYTLGDIRAAHRDLRAAVDRFPRRRDVFLYGESAGGTLAALLAGGRRVDGVAAHSPLVDLTGDELERHGWDIRCSSSCLGNYSPALRPVRQPVFAFVPTDDQVLDPGPSLDWLESERKVRGRSYPGLHMQPSPLGWYGDLHRAARFFERRISTE